MLCCVNGGSGIGVIMNVYMMTMAVLSCVCVCMHVVKIIACVVDLPMIVPLSFNIMTLIMTVALPVLM